MANQDSFSLQRKLAQIRHEAEEREAKRIAQAAGYPYVDLTKAPVSLEAISLISEADAKAAKVAAIEINVNEVAVVALDPASEAVSKIVKDLEEKKYKVKLFVGSLSGLEQVWHFYDFIKSKGKAITGRIASDALDEISKELSNFEVIKKKVQGLDFNQITVTELSEIILGGALGNKASDIHIEPIEKGVKVRFRVDGLLHDVFNMPFKNYEALISRIKLVSGLKINIHTEPQDGRFTIRLTKRDVEVRVSIIPSEFGETIVMRLLDPQGINITLESRGLRQDDLVIVERALAKPNGLILNTGPTGSGKTTTLYAFLKKIVNPEIKIITIEDPIEYILEGVEQTQVDPEVGYTFASGLRAIVRQDPDVILVGEIRDVETADIALEAALTGHLVLSTLHTNDAVGAVPRLVDLGVKASIIGPAMSLIIAQRLVRKLCKFCKKEVSLSQELKSKIEKFLDGLPPRVDRKPYANFKIYEAGGCSQCNNFGYSGRMGIFEFFEAGDEFQELILKEVSEVALKKLADKQGMVTMQEDGILKVLLGETSIEEVEGATGPIDLLKPGGQ